MLVHFTYASSEGSEGHAYPVSPEPFATRIMQEWTMMSAKAKLSVFDSVPYASSSQYYGLVCQLCRRETTGSSSGSLQLRPFSKWERLLKERICSQRERINSSLWYGKHSLDCYYFITHMRNCVIGATPMCV